MGAEDWQDTGVGLVENRLPPDVEVHVANPRWTGIPPAEKLTPPSQRT